MATVSPDVIKATRAAGGKRLAELRTGLDRDRLYSVEEAVKTVKARAKAKFDETVEISMNLGVDPKHADQMVRGVCNLPNGSGRTARVAVFARGAKADEAKAAGADVVGAEELVEQVQKGQINFDRCIATPDMMGLVGRLGKVLGPRGLMPNPRVGTVTMDVTTAVQGAKGGSVEFRVEKAGIVHAGVGKASFSEAQLVDNIKAFVEAVVRAEAGGRQGQLPEEGVAVLDDGPRRQGRHGLADERHGADMSLAAGGSFGIRRSRRYRTHPSGCARQFRGDALRVSRRTCPRLQVSVSRRAGART